MIKGFDRNELVEKSSEQGVSEVVGEMLMIAVVIILISVFSATLFNFLPAEREPSVSILMSGDSQNITLWHKGGDWVRVDEISLVIVNETYKRSFTTKDGTLLVIPNKSVFDVGSNVTARINFRAEGNETVKLTTPRAVIFAGKVIG